MTTEVRLTHVLELAARQSTPGKPRREPVSDGRPVPAVGQTWSVRDKRYDGLRYVTVECVADGRVFGRHRSGRRTSYRADRFGRAAFSFCGYEGPGVLPAYTRRVRPCFPCAPKPQVLDRDALLAVGFGFVTVTVDSDVVWRGDDERLTLARFEREASKRPGDWRVRFEGALSETLYQRQDAGWVLVFAGMGFA